MITHNTYFDGKVQSLGFVMFDNKRRATIGVLQSGEYDFGVAEQTECIEVTSGKLVVGSKEYNRRSEPCVFTRGDSIIMRAIGITSYICTYHD